MANNELNLAPCPFCGCAMQIESNRDWHHLTGEHDDSCPFESDEDTMCVPATDEMAQWLDEAWNRRAIEAQAEPSGALPERPCSLRGTGKCACPTACQLNMDAARGQTQSYVILGQQGGGDAVEGCGAAFTRHAKGNQWGVDYSAEVEPVYAAGFRAGMRWGARLR